jgi:hypothetical protein
VYPRDDVVGQFERDGRHAWPSGLQTRPSGAGRDHYLPEMGYALWWPGAEVGPAERSTVRCVSRWADWCEVFMVGGGGPRRGGPLPPDPTERQAAVEELLDWVEGHLDPFRLSIRMVAINLYARGEVLLEQHDGVPGPLTLSPAQFGQLQDWWEADGLPRDLYYPAREHRALRRTIPGPDGPMEVLDPYTPRQWRARNDTAQPGPSPQD